jgi:tRNA nucleotidyltransferase (CCA-adding enzyme)
MSLEDKLAGWTGPSSDTEQDKQERTERMIREAVQAHPAFKGYAFNVYAKGSYANNTNVRADSDVDIAVQCQEVFYWEEAVEGRAPLIQQAVRRHVDADGAPSGAFSCPQGKVRQSGG